MSNKDPDFPSIEKGDSDDVRWALETAGAMWDQGEKGDSLRWLKRAADSASDEGEDIRSVGLARSRAELRSYLDLSGVAAAAAATSTPAKKKPASAPPATPASASSGSAAPADAGAAKRPPPPKRSAPAGAATPPPAQSAPAAAAASPSAKPSAPAAAAAATPPTPNMDDQPTLQKPIRAEDLALQLQERLAQQGAPGDGAAPAETAGIPTKLAKHQAVRVALQPVEGLPGVMLARPLGEGEQPGTGHQQALLVALDSNVDLLDVPS